MSGLREFHLNNLGLGVRSCKSNFFCADANFRYFPDFFFTRNATSTDSRERKTENILRTTVVDDKISANVIASQHETRSAVVTSGVMIPFYLGIGTGIRIIPMIGSDSRIDSSHGIKTPLWML